MKDALCIGDRACAGRVQETSRRIRKLNIVSSTMEQATNPDGFVILLSPIFSSLFVIFLHESDITGFSEY